MSDHRILIVGNAGSGKTTMACAVHERRGLPHFDLLPDWVRRYDVREDEYGLARHRALSDGFAGPKREYLDIPSYSRG